MVCADCGVLAELSRGPCCVCPVLTRGSWPCSEADHQTGQTLAWPCNHSCVPMGTKFIRSTSLCWYMPVTACLYVLAPQVTQINKVLKFLNEFLLSPLSSALAFHHLLLSLTSRVSLTSCINISNILFHIVPWPQLWQQSEQPWQSGPRGGCHRHWKPHGSQPQPDLKSY